MSVSLTPAARAALSSTLKSPNLVLKIQGVDTLYGAGVIEQAARIGDGSLIGDPVFQPDRCFYVGGNARNYDQRDIITLNGTSTSIKQTLDPSKGQGSSVSTLLIALIDNGEVTELITPGEVVDDILSAKCMVYLGFQGTSWPEDYSVVFRGFITDITSDPGKITFLLNGTDERQRSSIYTQVSSDVVSTIGATDQSLSLVDGRQVLQAVTGANGQMDPSFQSYLKIDDEIVQYQTVTPSTTNGVTTYVVGGITRGAFNTTAVKHEAGASAQTFYRLTGNTIDLALKLMASGDVDQNNKVLPFTSLAVTSMNVGGIESYNNSLFFARVVNDNDLGLIIGDYVTVTGSSVSSNNVSGARILNVVQGELGTFVIVNQTLSPEASSLATASFTSQYATLPDGCEMAPDEFDTPQFLRIKQLYLNSVAQDFYLKDTLSSAKDFLEQNLYLPVSAYSIPRKAKSSVGYFAGPIPGTDIVTFNSDNIKNPASVNLKRSTNRDFYNEVVYKFDEDAVEDQYNSGYIGLSQTSKNRISNSGNKTLTIEAKGLRSLLSAQVIVQDQVNRRFNRYQFGAETFSYSSLLGDGYTVEVGDIVIFDGEDLNLPDIKTGNKGISPRLLEIQNREIQLKTGDLKFTAIDTNFSGQGRHALISPSSIVAQGLTTSTFTVQNMAADQSGIVQPEYLKWINLIGARIQMRSPSYGQVAQTYLVKADSNQFTVSPALPFLPRATMIVEFAPYSTNDNKVQHLVYGYMRNSPFPDQTQQYTMI